MRNTLLAIGTVLTAVMVWSVVWISPCGAETRNCKEIKKVTIHEKEFIQQGTSYRELKEALVKRCLQEAVRQATGTEIRSNVGLSTRVSGNQVDEKMDEVTVEKARGHIESYRIAAEDIQPKGSMNLLVLTVEAQVCVPEESALQEVVSVGDFTLAEGKRNAEFRGPMMTAVNENKKLQLATYLPGKGYHDIVLTGNLVSVSSGRSDRDGAIGVSLAGAFLGGRLGNKLEQHASRQVKRVSVVVTVQAKKTTEKEAVSETREAVREIALNADMKAVVVPMINEAAYKAATAVCIRLAGGESTGSFLGGMKLPSQAADESMDR